MANPGKPALRFKAPRPYLQDALTKSFELSVCSKDNNLFLNPITYQCEAINHYVMLAHSNFENSLTLPSKTRASQSNDFTIEFQVKWLH